jgi:hypothetical protein
MLTIGGPVSGPTRPGIINTGTPRVGDLVKRSSGQNCEWTKLTASTDPVEGRIIAVDGAYITVELLASPVVMELPYDGNYVDGATGTMTAETISIGQTILAGAAITVKGVASRVVTVKGAAYSRFTSAGNGIVVAKDHRTGYVLVAPTLL